MDYSGRGSHVFRLPATANKFPRRSFATLVGDGDKPDGFGPSACQTYRDIDLFLAEPDEDKFFDAIQAYMVTCVVSCRVAKD